MRLRRCIHPWLLAGAARLGAGIISDGGARAFYWEYIYFSAQEQCLLSRGYAIYGYLFDVVLYV
jgi:hypothetical protein